ncbi:MAG: hypothetical protein L0Y64_12555 [Myxococcaceae bacterium]|nr:hypothetical protein [Myxococcaceae bacterium]
MESVRRASTGNVCLPEQGSEPSVPTVPYAVQRGDTLSKLAARLQGQGIAGSREDLVRLLLSLNPQVQHRDRIVADAVLQLPAAASFPTTASGVSGGDRVEAYAGGYSRMPVAEERTGAERGLTAGALVLTRGAGLPERPEPALFQMKDGTRFDVSADGTPLYKQNALAGEGGWGRLALNEDARRAATIGREGCAMTCVAMALSKLSGQTITPDVLDRYLDANGGYAPGCNALRWATSAGVTGAPMRVERHAGWEPDRIDTELASGRPVVIGVDCRPGSAGGINGTDHWLCLTRRDPEMPDVYYANDPASGTEVKLMRQPGGALVQVLEQDGTNAKRAPYRTSGPWTSFGVASRA